MCVLLAIKKNKTKTKNKNKKQKQKQKKQNKKKKKRIRGKKPHVYRVIILKQMADHNGEGWEKQKYFIQAKTLEKFMQTRMKT